MRCNCWSKQQKILLFQAQIIIKSIFCPCKILLQDTIDFQFKRFYSYIYYLYLMIYLKFDRWAGPAPDAYKSNKHKKGITVILTFTFRGNSVVECPFLLLWHNFRVLQEGTWHQLKRLVNFFPKSENQCHNSPCRSSSHLLYFFTCQGAFFSVASGGWNEWMTCLTFALRIKLAWFWRLWHLCTFHAQTGLSLVAWHSAHSCVSVCPQKKLNHKANPCHSVQKIISFLN